MITLITSLILMTLLFGLVYIDASGDASEGRWYYISKDVMVGMIPVIALGFALAVLITELTVVQAIWAAAKISLAYVGLRLAFFNPIFNKIDDRHWYEFGTTKTWDKWNNKLKQSPVLLQTVYIVIGVLAAMQFTGFFEIFNK